MSMDIDDILADVSDNAIPQETRDLQELTRAWISERVAPEILPYPEALMQRTMDRIRRQIELVEMQTGDMDPRTNFRLIIIQTELERFKYLIRSFLRARIAKIDRYAFHILSTPAMKARLSTTELQYVTQHQALLQDHYGSSFLRNFPEQLRRLDDTAGGISMIEQPDLDTAVFCRILKDSEDPIELKGTGALLDLKRGNIHVIRYSAIREALLRGDVELI
ncbi:MAG: GINS complex subunit [Caeruleum heppii]|nr:MAG: GINS complex subunit [Caeruleum heppii]